MRQVLQSAIFLLAMMSASLASEQNWPQKPIHIIVPLPAGSAADVVARLIGAELSNKLGQPVVIDNRDGGSGAIGTGAIAHADPDGYTLGVATTTSLVTAPILNTALPYKPKTDFSYIAMVGYSPYVFVVNASVPAKTVPAFIALAKERAGHITYSSVGEASLAKLGAELFANMSGVKLNEVPYKSSTQAVIDLISGRIDSMFGILTTTQHYIREGKLIALGVTTVRRTPDFPDIPTIAESGLPGYEASLWLAFIAPAGLPNDIVTRLNEAINAIINNPRIKATLTAQAIAPNAMSSEEFKAQVSADVDKWTGLAAKAGL